MTSHISAFLQHNRPDLAIIPRDSWFDNSTIESHLDCNRLAWYNYFHHIESKSAAMAAGTVWHSGIEELHKTGDILKANLALAREYEKHKIILQAGASRHAFGVINDALHEYDRKYTGMAGIEYHEQEFKFAVWIPASALTPGFWLVGRFDGIITYNGDFLLLENKTTSQLGGSYLAGLDMSRQASTYTYAIQKIMAENGWTGPPVRGVLFNIVKLGTKLEFLRHTILRHPKALLEFEAETIRVVSDIRAAWTGTEKPIKNTRSCNRYGECQFIDLCKAWAGGKKDLPPGLFTNYIQSGWRPF